jgi:hypothetical protein
VPPIIGPPHPFFASVSQPLKISVDDLVTSAGFKSAGFGLLESVGIDISLDPSSAEESKSETRLFWLWDAGTTEILVDVSPNGDVNEPIYEKSAAEVILALDENDEDET